MNRVVAALALLVLMGYVLAQDSPAIGFRSCAALLPAGFEYRFNAEITIDTRSAAPELSDGRYGVDIRSGSGELPDVAPPQIEPFVECLDELITSQLGR
jgi:hypothetical protein